MNRFTKSKKKALELRKNQIKVKAAYSRADKFCSERILFCSKKTFEEVFEGKGVYDPNYTIFQDAVAEQKKKYSGWYCDDWRIYFDLAEQKMSVEEKRKLEKKRKYMTDNERTNFRQFLVLKALNKYYPGKIPYPFEDNSWE